MTPRRATRGEWAVKLAVKADCPSCAEQYGMGDNGDVVHVPSVARLLVKEHARAVRIVKAEIAFVKKDQHTYKSEEKCLILGSLETVLKKLTSGR